MRFSGRKVVITGAAGVYGRELAAAFAAEGAMLLLSDRDEADLAAAVPAGLPPDRVTLHAADLSQDAGIDGLIAAALAGGAPDVLVNNAGIYPFIPLMEVTPAEYDRILAVNSFGTLTVLLIAVHGFIGGRPDFLDISLVYALINFIGTVALMKYVETAPREDAPRRGERTAQAP